MDMNKLSCRQLSFRGLNGHHHERIINCFLCTGGVSFAFYVSLLISKLFCTEGCVDIGMGGGGGEGERYEVNTMR